MSALTGKQVAGFELLDELGRGGMGVVYKARQVSLDRMVAVKFLPAALAKDEKKVQRFIREARAAGKLSHPNIVAAYDVGQAGNVYYIAMEYVDGQTAYKMLQHRGSLMEEEVVEIGIQAAMALRAAHAAGILHRDVKPDNFLMDQSGNLKLADLGLARFEGDGGEEGHLTQDGTAMGTPHYMPPEAARGEKLDARSDLYSLGASLYLLASSHTPFKAPTSAAILVKVISEDPRPLREIAPHLSTAFVAVVEKLMQKDPAQRYQSADEVVKALEKAKSAPHVAVGTAKHGAWKPAAMPDGEHGPAITPAMFAVLGGVIGLVILFGIFWMMRAPAEPEPAPQPKVATQASEESETESEKPDRSKAGSKLSAAERQEQKKAEVDALRAIRAVYDDLIRQHRQRLARDPAALAEEWDKLIRDNPNALFIDKARRSAAEARNAADNLTRDWQQAKDQAEKALAANDLKGAADGYIAFMRRYPETAEAKEAGTILTDLHEKVVAWVKEQTTAARAKADAGDFAGAQAVLEKLKTDLTPKIYEETQVAAVAEAVEKMRAEAEAKLARLKDADEKRIADAHAKAEAAVRTDPLFQFDRAVEAFTTAVKLVEQPSSKEAANAWAERYRRAGKAWTAVQERAKGGFAAELKALGRYDVPGKVTASNDRGLTYSSPDLPAGGQLVPWKDLSPENAVELAQLTGVTPLEKGLLAYAVGAMPQAVVLLKPDQFTDAVDKELARGAWERAGEGSKEKLAETALADAQAAKEKDDAKAAAEAIASLSAGGSLADTDFAKEHAAEIAAVKEWTNKTAAATTQVGPGPAKSPDRTTPETVAELKKLGWDSVVGLWIPDPEKKGIYKATNATLRLDSVDAVGTLTFKLDAGAQVSLYGRYAPNDVPPLVRGFLREGVGEIAPGYGVEVTATGAKAYGPFDPPAGMHRRAPELARARFPVSQRSDLIVREGIHTLTVQVQGDTVSIDFDKQRRSFRNIRMNGTFVLEIKGSADVQAPMAKKM